MRSSYRDTAELLEKDGKYEEAAKAWRQHADLCERLAKSDDHNTAQLAAKACEYTYQAIQQINQQLVGMGRRIDSCTNLKQIHMDVNPNMQTM